MDGRLIKLDNRQMAMFLVLLMQALFHTHLGGALVFSEAFSAARLAECVAHLPEALLPGRRKRRSYISSQLSQHEVNSKHPYGKKLFLRLNHGQYILNPGLKIRQGKGGVRFMRCSHRKIWVMICRLICRICLRN